MTDDVAVLLIALLCASGLAAVGAWALHLLRRRSMSVQLVLVAVTAMLSSAAGSVGTGLAMFRSSHDLGVLLSAATVAGCVGLAVAVWTGHRLAGAVLRVAEGVGSPPPTGADLPRELAGLARHLAEVHASLEEQRARERAREIGRRELISWVSHDLRSPLAGLRAMAEALLDGMADDAVAARYHRRMHQDVLRLSGMVDDLVQLSLLQSDDPRLRLRRVPLPDVVDDALAAAEAVARSKGVRLDAVFGPVVPVSVDPEQMARVMGNLLTNAIRHSPAGSAVEVVASAGGGWAAVAVTDACGGIPEPDLHRVFDVGFRGQAARRPDAGREVEGGAGLGLTIVSRIAAAHGGTVSVVNVAGGCRFTVRLPLTPQGAASGPVERTPPGAGGAHRPGAPGSTGPTGAG